MIKCQLLSKRRKYTNFPLANGQFSWRHGDKWFITRVGTSHAFLFAVTDYDTAGLRLLKSQERTNG